MFLLLAAAIAICFPSAPGAHPAEPDEAERLVATVGFDGFGLVTHRDRCLVTAQRYAAGRLIDEVLDV